MENKWEKGEPGPQCFCGKPTVVVLFNENEPALMCMFHTKGEGATFNLPLEKAEWWPTPPTREVLAQYMQSAPIREEEDDE
jgi:hypothetical protein